MVKKMSLKDYGKSREYAHARHRAKSIADEHDKKEALLRLSLDVGQRELNEKIEKLEVRVSKLEKEKGS